MRKILGLDSKSSAFLMAVLTALIGPAGYAQTPDDDTPAAEEVCDGESGAAFGLCNAYCEAMDCELATPSASPTACLKVRDKFIQATGRDLPCEASCPCAEAPSTRDAWAAVIDSVDSTWTCDEDADLCGPCGPNFTGTHLDSPSSFAFLMAYSWPESGRHECRVQSPDTSRVTLVINPDQVSDCRQVLKDALTAAGSSCS